MENNTLILNTIKDAEVIIGILLENKYRVTFSAVYGEYPYENRVKYVKIEYYREDFKNK